MQRNTALAGDQRHHHRARRADADPDLNGKTYTTTVQTGGSWSYTLGAPMSPRWRTATPT